MTKVKELLNIRINEHIEDIYFVSPLESPLTRKCFLLTYCLPFSNGEPFEQVWYLFERLGLSVPKEKLSSVQMAWAICSKKNVICLKSLCYPFEKKLSSVRTAWATHLKKIVIHSNGYGYPFEKEIVDSLSD